MNTSKPQSGEDRISDLVGELSRNQYTRELNPAAAGDPRLLAHMAALAAELKDALDAALANLPPDDLRHSA